MKSLTQIARFDSWPPIGLCVLAFWLRVIGLNARPVWYDEAFAVLFAEKGFSAMLVGTLTPVQGAAADVHPIAYYTALNGWMQLLGQSPLAVRLLSVYAGVLAVAVCYGVGRQLFGKGSARAGMLIAASLPFQIYYGQEARMYASLALFCALTIWFYLRALKGEGANRNWGSPDFNGNGLQNLLILPEVGRLRTPISRSIRESRNWLNWVGVGVSAAAALYMHNLAGIFLLVFGLSTLPKPKVFAKVALAGALAFALWLPWLLNLPGQFAKLQQAYWVTRPNLLTLLQTLIVYHSGEELLEARVMLPLTLFVSLALPLMALFQVFKGVVAPALCGLPRPDTRRVGWLLALAFGPALLLFLVSLYQPIYIQRALLPAGLMYAPVLGWLLWPPRLSLIHAPAPIRLLLALALGSVVIFGLTAHYTFAQFPRPNFQEAVTFLKTHFEPGDVVVHSNKLSFLPMYYYDRTLPQTFVADPSGSGSDTLALPTQQVLGLFASPDVAAVTWSAKRIWFVIFDKALAEFAPTPHPHLVWLEDHYRQQSVDRFSDLLIYEFAAP